jgi:hypothetical protein
MLIAMGGIYWLSECQMIWYPIFGGLVSHILPKVLEISYLEGRGLPTGQHSMN